MSIKYYPSTKIKTNQKALLGEFTLNGVVYSGSYYSTYDGKFFTGPDPILGSNQELIPALRNSNSEYVLGSSTNASSVVLRELNSKLQTKNKTLTQPVSYQPITLDSDYSRGYFTRYFVKRTNQRGYVMEISEEEFESIRNGTATYDISFYQTVSLIWKLTGPLRSKRISQYQTREGIVDTNQRIVESLNKSFPGLKEFIGEDYAKFSRPTE
jgi:hypothetical protein